MNLKKVWLVGAGQMASDYAAVLSDLDVEFQVIGRGEDSAESFAKQTGIQPYVGGLASFLENESEPCTHAIVSVGIEELANTTIQLLQHGVKNILVEKPGGLYSHEFQKVSKLTQQHNAKVFIGYNRRFYASTLAAQEIIRRDGGVSSFNFEFTEWTHEIETLKLSREIKENWFLANSTHVVDLAFHLGGKPKEMASYTSGGIEWHRSASIFSGAGMSESGALFNYHANWESAGRWSVEILTKEHRLIFRPMEKLMIQKRGSIQVDPVEGIDYSLDEKYKPGLFRQTSNFIYAKLEHIIDIVQINALILFYNKISSNRFNLKNKDIL
jgi:predicted dehydrogenase